MKKEVFLVWLQKTVLPFLPLANIPIRKDAAFLPSQPSYSTAGVAPCKQLLCALTLPGLENTVATWDSKGSRCYLQTGLGIYDGSGWPEAGSDMEKGSHDKVVQSKNVKY